MSTSARDVPFADVARHQLTTYDGPPRVLLGSAVTAVVPDAVAGPGRTLVAAFQGAQRTGGYAITIDRIQRDGERLVVRATFAEPPRGAVVTQVLTSPVHVVSIASSDATGARTVVLLDGTGAERARAAVD